ncbi:MAG: type I-C CRISPR-associated endonuclease Cas1c [Prevotella sp.]|nr:type I-C CRISPR-associated endonuclease Cas1c [Prevotella sp.]
MRKLLNTLYITTPESYLSKDGLNIVISIKQEEVFRIPIINIENIVTFGYMGASPGVMKLCCDYGVSLTFLSPSGRFVSRIQGAVHGNVILRHEQVHWIDNLEKSLHIARLMIAAKIQNYRNILRRFIRDNGEDTDIEDTAKFLDMTRRDALIADSLDSLRGIEGIAANKYFSVFSKMILHNQSQFPFTERNRRPPKDAVNAMLSLAYTLITNDMQSALETVGLDPFLGFFHTMRPGRTSLALDMVEELRAYLGDRFVLSLINRKQITSKDFLYQGEKGVILTESGRKTFLTAWQTRKRDEIMHPFLNEKVSVGLLPYIQAMLLARFIRGDIDDYPTFLIK